MVRSDSGRGSSSLVTSLHCYELDFLRCLPFVCRDGELVRFILAWLISAYFPHNTIQPISRTLFFVSAEQVRCCRWERSLRGGSSQCLFGSRLLEFDLALLNAWRPCLFLFCIPFGGFCDAICDPLWLPFLFLLNNVY